MRLGGGGRGRPRSDGRASVSLVKELLFEIMILVVFHTVKITTLFDGYFFKGTSLLLRIES